MPASYAYFFLAFYPSDLAAISMDRSGTTRIGSYLLNHSFMIPGFIGVGVSSLLAYGISTVVFPSGTSEMIGRIVPFAAPVNVAENMILVSSLAQDER